MKRFKQAEFATRVKKHMLEQMLERKRKISMREFATEIDIAHSTLSRIAKGRCPDLDTFFKLCFWMKEVPNTFYIR